MKVDSQNCGFCETEGGEEEEVEEEEDVEVSRSLVVVISAEVDAFSSPVVDGRVVDSSRVLSSKGGISTSTGGRFSLLQSYSISRYLKVSEHVSPK